jgi:hypothetical protein
VPQRCVSFLRTLLTLRSMLRPSSSCTLGRYKGWGEGPPQAGPLIPTLAPADRGEGVIVSLRQAALNAYAHPARRVTGVAHAVSKIRAKDGFKLAHRQQ